ncbi:molybdopterin-synthase adenylyltransferase MoeB [bacterium]|nr:molybdopterin-synthase adenylyltransferase MoeB [bacterium]
MVQPFNKEEIIRYQRNIALPQVRLEGQQRLKKSSVLIVGLGGLGVPVAQYLAAAGVGRLGLVDFDCVDISNLQRQVLYGTSMAGRRKVECAKERLHDLNPHITIDTFPNALTPDNALDIINSYDVVADAADNFAARYLINDACVLANRPNVSGSVYGFEGQLSVFNYDGGPCYRCIYPIPPEPASIPSCAESGVLGVLPGIIGALQGAEILKILLHIGCVASGRVTIYDVLSTDITHFKTGRNPSCAVCGDNPSITALDGKAYGDSASDCSSHGISPALLRELFNTIPQLTLIDVREPFEYEICHIKGARLIPLNHLERQIIQLDKAIPVIVYCKTGLRGRKAVDILLKHNFHSVKNLTGGIIRWIEHIDPSLPLY